MAGGVINIDNFVWLRPAWLLAIPVVLVWLWMLSKRAGDAGWNAFLSKQSIKHLRMASVQPPYFRYFAAPLVLGCIAMAGPSLMSGPHSTHTDYARILILDLSPSMLARDIKPDRLTQARYKAIDFLRRHRDGEIALIVYAQTAYRVTPLTDDPSTIETLIPTLHPDIMPAAGSQVEAAIQLATDMLQNASIASGDIILITDGVADAALTLLQAQESQPYRLSILGIGTTDGATIPKENSLLLDSQQQPVIARLNSRALQQLAAHFNGRYSDWSVDSSDIDYLSSQRRPSSRWFSAASSTEADSQSFDRHQDLGYWLLLPLLLSAIIAFRKNLLYTLLPLWLINPADLVAADLSNLWRNNNQQGLQHLHSGNASAAYDLFDRPKWKAIAAYQQGDYGEALQLLEPQTDTSVYAQDLYNRGNALAMTGDLTGAIKSLTLALQLYGTEQDQQRADALHNIALLKRLIDIQQKNDDQSTARGSQNRDSQNRDSQDTGSQNNNTQNSDNQDAQTANSTQASIGGATGPGQSLDQQAVSENQGDTTSANVSDDSPVPDDASVRETTDNKLADQPAMHNPATSPTPESTATVDNNSEVLSPYSEQWLRDLPQDPGGFLRRKFQYLYQTQNAADQPSEPSDSKPQSLRY